MNEWISFEDKSPILDTLVWFRKHGSEANAIGLFVGFIPVPLGQRKYRPCLRNEAGYIMDQEPDTQWKVFRNDH